MAWWDDIAGSIGDAAGYVFGSGGGDVVVPAGGSSSQPAIRPASPPLTGYAAQANNSAPTGLAAGSASAAVQGSSAGGNPNIQRIMSILGVSAEIANSMLTLAALGDTGVQKNLAAMGIEPYASALGGGSSGSGGSGGSGGSAGRVLFPDEIAQINAETQRVIAQTGIYNGQSRQIGALFDPNYADGAMVPLPDGTSRINGTEIIIDARERGQFKPVANAPGYMVDPVTGTVIDTNGNQIAREQLQETIRSNSNRDALTQAGINADVEDNRNRLALDTTVDVGDLNLRAATSENQFALENGLQTNRLNLDAFTSAGTLNNDAVNVETNRLNALTGRSASAGGLALDKQQLDDARVQNVIALAANPQNFVQREYEIRAIQAPAGINSPAYRENTQANQAINDLNTVPNVDNLLPTYQQPKFAPVALPNSSLPRVTAPTYTQLNTTAPIQAAAPANDPNRMVAAYSAESNANLRAQGVPEWAIGPTYAYGTGGTTEDEFVVGDPQADGLPNPEQVTVNNPGPNTNVEVQPMDMNGLPLEGDVTLGREMQMGNESQGSDGLAKLLASVLVEISNQWGSTGGEAEYAYGTDWGNSNSSRNRTMGGSPNWNNRQGNSNNSPSNPSANNPNNNNSTVNFQPIAPPATGNSGNGQSTSMSTPNNGVFGPRDSQGNFLGLLTSNTDSAIQNMPAVRYAQDYGNQLDFNQLGTGTLSGAFGTQFPDVGGLNLRQLDDWKLDPDVWGTMSSLYGSANRNLQSIYNRVQANAPRGNAVQSQSVIRT